jgi:DNA polymerase III epsilon subunit-like protein
MKKVIAIAIDDEFTSFDMQGGDLITFGAVEILDDFTLGREFYGECKATNSMYFTEKAQEIHGISYFKAMTFPEPKETMLRFLQWLHGRMDCFQIPIAYHGSWDFDKKWIEKTMTDAGLQGSFHKAFFPGKEHDINVLKLCRKNLKHLPAPVPSHDSNGKKVAHYGLRNVADFYGLELQHHNALSDAKVTAHIYCNIMNKKDIWTGELF